MSYLLYLDSIDDAQQSIKANILQNWLNLIHPEIMTIKSQLALNQEKLQF